MFESMVGSMTTSMDLARSFMEERGDIQLDSEDQQVKGIDALARLIEIGKRVSQKIDFWGVWIVVLLLAGDACWIF